MFLRVEVSCVDTHQFVGLDDLCVRFIVNLPREELESVERICFQVEEAQWFYEDFVRPLDPNLPSLNLKQFCLKIFQHCPLFSGYDDALYTKAFAEFLAYKTRVPVRGAILLNEAMTEVILVKGWKKGANWSFPRGKINKDEKDLDCAIREVYEETGYDVRGAGLVEREEEAKYIEVTMREQHMKLFVFAGVPMDTHFEPRTRKEISKIEWYKLSDLPTLKKAKQQQHEAQEPSISGNKFYMVAPFLRPLKNIISQLRKQSSANNRKNQTTPIAASAIPEPQETHEQIVSSEGDMSRLMAQLRQSKQASRENNFPEVSHPAETAKIAAAQLKSFLNQPSTKVPVQSAGRDSAAARETKASAMLTLLRSGSNKSSVRPMEQGPPQTPFEQIFGQPSRPPPSPKHRTVRASRELSLPQPPSFPFSPSQAGNHATTQQDLPVLHEPTISSSGKYQPQQHSNAQTSLQARSQQPQLPQASAPYQRTGDPQFAQASSYPGTSISLIPPASNLPTPKLNSHSSALLSLFKGNAPGKHILSSASNIPPRDDGLRLELSASSPSTSTKPQPSFVNGLSPAQPPKPTPDPVLSPFTLTSRGIPQRSSQQEALLGLFKSSASTSKPPPSLAPPSAPVELSATQSPTHFRASTPLNKSENKVSVPIPLVNGRVTIQKRPNRSPILKPARVSATVTGPLNVPQFDKISKKIFKSDDKLDDATLEQEGQSPKLQQPIKILSRPSTANKPNQDFIVTKSVSPKPSSPRESSRRHKRGADSKDMPKLFQPQILKRPVEVPIAEPPKAPAPSPIPKLITKDTFLRDSRPTQTQEQKTALLSLFSKPGSIVPATIPYNDSLVSPLSTKPPVSSSMPSPIGTMSRSRIGSLASLADDGLMSGSQTPKATASPVDKKFLLGFLDGVAKEGRR